MSSKPIVLQFIFDDFEGLPDQAGAVVNSKSQKDGNGRSWQLNIYPGGKILNPLTGEEYLSVYLQMKNGQDADAKVSLSLRNASGGVHRHKMWSKARYGPRQTRYGQCSFVRRSEILDSENGILSGGALVIDVVIQITDGKRKFQPTHPTLENMQKLCGSDDYSDVKFKIGKTIIPAHKLILKMNAPILADFCGDKTTPVVIKDTTLTLFRTILQYVYGGDVPDDEVVRTKGKAIIQAADRYEIVGLKMAVEAALVQQRLMDLDTVADWLVFAHSKTCPLLKEYALSYLSCRAKDVMAHESSKILKESPELMEEIVLAMSSDESKDIFSKTSKMSVDELRAVLKEKGLDVDGSKETLVSRLVASEQSG